MKKRQPIRCFEGSAKPHEPFWRAKNATETESGEAEIDFYGAISEYSWFEDDITPQSFKEDLHRIGAGGPVTIRINSGGGDVIAASVIRAIIQDYSGKVTARIDGIAASAAVVVALAANVVKIQDTAYMMIHDPGISVMFAYLDVGTLEGLVSMLKSVRQGILDTYATKTGITADRLGRMMTDETWMSANEAVKLGFADEVIGGGQVNDGAVTSNNANLLKNYVHVPVALLNQASEPVQSVAVPELSDEVKRLRDIVQIYK